MITTLLGLCSVLAPGGGGCGEPPPFHAVAFVNDSLSHGTLGDNRLSLDEAIRLHNGTLQFAALSAAEQAQLSLIPNTGGTTDVTWIDIDGGDTPVITIQQNLTPVLATPFGLLIKGFGERPTLDFSGANVTEGLYAPTNAITLQDLIFFGGPYGVRIVQTDVTGQPGAVLQGVRFENQTQFGARVTATVANGFGRVVFDDCEFVNTPKAIEYSDTGADRTTIFELNGSRITGAVQGVEGVVGVRGSGRFKFERLIIDNSGVGISLQLPPSNGRPTFIEGAHVRIRAGVCVQVSTAIDAPTWLQCASWNLLSRAATNVALTMGALNHQVYGDLNQFHGVGNVVVGTGGATQALTFRNGRFANGGFTIAKTTTQPVVLRESRFTNCQVDKVGPGSVTVSGRCFVGGSLGVVAPGGAFVANGCYIQTQGPGVTASQSLPVPWLGSIAVTPDDVQIGNNIQLGVDLPPGVVAVIALGEPALPVPVLPPPFYVYVDPAQYVIVPGVFTAQQAFTWNVPNLFQFVGVDLIAQPVVLPTAGVQAPALQLPPGWRFVLL